MDLRWLARELFQEARRCFRSLSGAQISLMRYAVGIDSANLDALDCMHWLCPSLPTNLYHTSLAYYVVQEG